MYFDAVIFTETQDVLFNGTPEETKAYLTDFEVVGIENWTVMRGRDLRAFSVAEYLAL